MNDILGKPIDRIDGRLKVTGAATYAAEFAIKNLAYAACVQSTISKGRIRNIDTTDAEKHQGVIGVMTHKNAMRLQSMDKSNDPGSGKTGEKNLLPLQNDQVFYDGQHIAVVIANSFEAAQHGARLVKVEYDEEKPIVEIEDDLSNAYKPKGGAQVTRGTGAVAIQSSEFYIHSRYETPVYHHNPMEPQATIAVFDGDTLTLYDGTQSVNGSRNAIAHMLMMDPSRVRLICLYLGGGFGCKGFTWAHSVLAPMAAKFSGRPVKLVLDRMQMFTSNGRRSRTIQDISLGASKDGKLNAINHATTAETSFVDEWLEQAGTSTKILYNSPNIEVSHSLVKINKGTPCPTRAPGEAPGTYAFEVAMDELAEKLQMDPVALRMANYAEIDPQTSHPWSSKFLSECYEKGAKAIGWSARNPVPGEQKEGRLLIGYGMATAVYPANRGNAAAKVRVYKDGRVVAACGTQDIGTGTYTILAQTVADALGVPISSVEIKLGDTNLPKGPNSGGSQTAASACPAVRAAALDLKAKLIKQALGDKKSLLFGKDENEIAAEAGGLYSSREPLRKESYIALISRMKVDMIEGEADLHISTREGAKAQPPNPGEKSKPVNPFAKADQDVDRARYSFHSFGAQFVKVLVDPDLGTVRVAKIAGVMDIGKVLNLKTAENQIMGGMIWGIGMALMEHTAYDENNGRVVTRDLADYLVPVNADMPEFHVEFLDKADPYISPMGARGIGEIGITGITAAIANAVYNATGKRVRNLPITPDKLI